MRKIVIFPPADIEDYLLYLDWMRSLTALGYEVFVFEEDLHSLIQNIDGVKERLEAINPDLVLGFNMYFFGFKVEMGVLFVSLFELMKLPYVSIVTDRVFRFCVGLKSPVRFFRFLKGIIVYDPVYEELIRQVLNVEAKYIPFIFPELEVNWDDVEFRKELVLMDYSFEKNISALSKEFNTPEILTWKEKLDQDMDNLDREENNILFADIADELKGTALSCFVYEDCYCECLVKALSEVEKILSERNISYVREVKFTTLSSGVKELRRYLGVVGVYDPYTRGELNRFIWFTIRAGALPIVPAKGLLTKDLLNVFTHPDEIVEVVSRMLDKETRISCCEEVYNRFLNKFPAVKWVEKACQWIETVL